jgi:PAS domain S-box-containing protein
VETRSRILFFWRVLVLCVAIMGLADANAVSASSPEKTNRVLYLNSYHRGYIWSDGIEQGLRERLKASGRKVDLYIEFLDTQRYPEHDHFPALAEVFAMKHRKTTYDAIVVSDNDAFTFAIKYRERIFPKTPLIFCGYNSFRPEVLKGITNVTGVNEEVDFTGTIDMALAVQPKTEALVFITSDYYASGQRNQERVETRIVPAYRDRYKVSQFKNLYLRDMEQRLAQLPPRTLVFVFGAPLDNRDGPLFVPSPEYYRRVAEASTVPVYSYWDFTLNTGVMGGRIITGPDQGRMAADLALKVLDGMPVDNIPVVMETPTSKVFDFNAMERFGISETSLPPGSIVINRPDTFYHRYEKYVWIALGVFVLLSVLVVIFALQLRKSRILGARLYKESEERQKAVMALQQHQEHLEDVVTERTAELRRAYETLQEREALFRAMFDRHSAVMLLIDPDNGRIVDVNQAALTYYGYTLSEMKSMDIYAINQMSQEEIDQAMTQIKTEQSKHFEFRHRLANGNIREVQVYSSPVPFRGQKILFSIVHDITERKGAEAAINKYSRDLKERVKEINCLYSISELVRRNDISQEEILQECTSILSQAYQFQEITSCCITWGDHEYRMENFRKTAWSQNRAIMVHGEEVGTIEVCYLEEQEDEYEGPFLAEERKLLNNVADLLGRSAERKQAEEERERLILELREALSKVKTLSGLLPICASCKKIRNDKGYWEQMEVYIRDHSEADFSHSICPECAERLYPEYHTKKQKEQDL